MFKELHRNKKTGVAFNGELSEAITVYNEANQGDILASTLITIYFATILVYIFHDYDRRVNLRFQTSERVFNLTLFYCKSQILSILIRELLYADDVDFVAYSLIDMQVIMNTFSATRVKFELTISLKKKVKHTLAFAEIYAAPEIVVNELLKTHLSIWEVFNQRMET